MCERHKTKKLITGNSLKRSKVLFLYLFVIVAMLFPAGFIGESTVVSTKAASVRLNKSKQTMWVGDTLKLKVLHNKTKVKWSSSKKSVATVSAKGKVKAKKSGRAVITAKVKSKRYKCAIVVRRTTLSADKLTINYNSSMPLTLNNSKGAVRWTSSDTRIAYANGNEVLGKSVGEAVITAQCNGISYSCTVTVVSGETEQLEEVGIYTSKDKVALYIHTYHKLPSNFITKNNARTLGWYGGSLLDIAPDKCIGGDKFFNYEGSLPKKENRQYYECDINTLGARQRGTERLVYSNDGLIYYTPDHYNTFVLLYE